MESKKSFIMFVQDTRAHYLQLVLGDIEKKQTIYLLLKYCGITKCHGIEVIAVFLNKGTKYHMVQSTAVNYKLVLTM